MRVSGERGSAAWDKSLGCGDWVWFGDRTGRSYDGLEVGNEEMGQSKMTLNITWLKRTYL